MPRASRVELDALKLALRRAAACEGLTAGFGEQNLGAALVSNNGDPIRSRSSQPGAPAWARVLETADAARGELRDATLVLTAVPSDVARFVRAVKGRGVARVLTPDGPKRATLRRSLGRSGVALVDAPATQAERAAELHRRWRFYAAHGRPWVTLKAAVSLDGKVATREGHSKWITGEAARREGHRLRSRHGAIAVGVGTVLADDPRLDVRLVKGPSPRPVVFDGHLRTVVEVRSLQLRRPGVVLLHRKDAPRDRVERARALGLEPRVVRARRGGGLDVGDALRVLGSLGVRSLMVEGGGRLLSSFVAAELFEELWLFVAPRLLGGDAQSLLPGLDWGRVDRGVALEVRSRRALGDDALWVCARPGSRAGS